jgi:hypothetical protein
MVAVVAMFALLLLAPAVMAAPANDKFEDAQVVGPALPVLVSASNVGATREASDEPPGAFGAGHSIWFKWQAPSTGFVTVGDCEATFPTTLAVFTGAELTSLTPAASGNADEGPSCTGQGREYTFKATAGTVYSIVVDGNGFYLEGPPPATEGTFTLGIEATPAPANDDFQNAIGLKGEIFQQLATEQVYRASGSGYTWGASKQAGEPDHGGDPGGASVWYSWTAPTSGTARITACCGWVPLIGVYTGIAVNALTTVPVGPGVPVSGAFTVEAGVNYRIAVDGKFDAGAGEAETGSLQLSIYMLLPFSGSSGPAAISPTLDTTSPQTKLFKQVLRSEPPQYIFHFSSSEPGSTFRCRLDKGKFAKCRSPKRFKRLAPGRHTFQVYAVDAAGNRDSSPAVAHFKIKRLKLHGARLGRDA